MSSHIFIGISLILPNRFFFSFQPGHLHDSYQPTPHSESQNCGQINYWIFVKQCLVRHGQRATATQLLQVWLTLGCCLSLLFHSQVIHPRCCWPTHMEMVKSCKIFLASCEGFECNCLEDIEKNVKSLNRTIMQENTGLYGIRRQVAFIEHLLCAGSFTCCAI